MQFEKAVGALYETVFEPDRWHQAAVQCARLVQGTTFFLQVAKPAEGVVEVISGHGLAGLGIPAYEAYYHQVDVWKEGLLASARDRVHLYPEIVAQADYENSEVFVDWVKPGVGFDVYWGMGACLRLGSGEVAFLATHRTRRQGEMTESDRAVFQRLVPHVRRVLHMRRKAGELSARSQAMESACDRAACAAVLVNSKARLVYANRLAEQLLREGDGLRLRADGVLEAKANDETDALHDRIGTACAPRLTAEADADMRLRITRTTSDKPLIVSVCPLAAATSSFEGPLALVLIEDIWARNVPAPGRLRLTFGLTAAEARLVSLLAEGMSLRVAADRLGVTYNTARAHLRTTLSKCGFARQSELMLYVARLR